MPSEWPRSALDHAPASGGAAPSAQGPTRSRTPHPSYQRRHRNELSGRRRRSVLRVCHATKAWAAVLLPQGREAAQLPANAQGGGVKSASPHHRGRTRRRQCRADWPGPGGQVRQSETLRNGVGRAPAAHPDGGPRCRTTAASPHNCAFAPCALVAPQPGRFGYDTATTAPGRGAPSHCGSIRHQRHLRNRPAAGVFIQFGSPDAEQRRMGRAQGGTAVGAVTPSVMRADLARAAAVRPPQPTR